MGVQLSGGCAGSGGRGRIGGTSGGLHGQAPIQTAQDERYGVLGTTRQNAPLGATERRRSTVRAEDQLDRCQRPAEERFGWRRGVSTAADYLRFSQMLLNGGKLDDARVLSRSTVQLMTSGHLGTRINAPVTPGEVALGTPGYTIGLGFAVRQGNGVAGVHGSQGEFMWAGYAGTYFWVDPKEELVGIYMSQAPSPIRPYYRRLMKNLTYQSIND